MVFKEKPQPPMRQKPHALSGLDGRSTQLSALRKQRRRGRTAVGLKLDRVDTGSMPRAYRFCCLAPARETGTGSRISEPKLASQYARASSQLCPPLLSRMFSSWDKNFCCSVSELKKKTRQYYKLCPATSATYLQHRLTVVP